MSCKKNKVMVAMSGGVDSSVAAALLLESGFDCAGVHMLTNNRFRDAQRNAEGACKKLGMKLHIVDFRSEFEHIFDYFCEEYSIGRTPNPCAFCNSHIKFGKLWDFACQKGADFLATGHYARIIRNNSEPGLYEGVHPDKEQSYFLAMINRKMLEHILLPMGAYSKHQTRLMAEKSGLSCEKRPESQEICFLGKEWVSAVEQRRPELAQSGDIINSEGDVLGRHNGIHRFTIGQRRGLGVAMGQPYYVTHIDASNNTVTLGPKEEVMCRNFLAKNLNWLTDEKISSFRARVKIRYNNAGTFATVYPNGDDIRVEFDEEVSAIAPGQLAVFYVRDEIDERVVAGSWIEKVIDRN